jgi:hypothetical protein
VRDEVSHQYQITGKIIVHRKKQHLRYCCVLACEAT